MKMPFGKYKGHDSADIPDSYLIWLHDTVTLGGDLIPDIEAEMIARFKRNFRDRVTKERLVDENHADFINSEMDWGDYDY